MVESVGGYAGVGAVNVVTINREIVTPEAIEEARKWLTTTTGKTIALVVGASTAVDVGQNLDVLLEYAEHLLRVIGH
jgi:hypothetical protein